MREIILKHLLEHGSITSLEAIAQYKCTRLSQYILLLRKEGYEIRNEEIPFVHSVTGKKSSYVRYWLEANQ
jgi:hypothetical protein